MNKSQNSISFYCRPIGRQGYFARLASLCAAKQAGLLSLCDHHVSAYHEKLAIIYANIRV